ncbi:MAG TPA: NAD-dependent epimerase/dehydratase family protein [bacterium]|jgi:nucleoside-diphosphate-sugar epimerase/glycosyltransferase involved in cell wall biosynthesis|nr:NAD-dependent epimerase/dehydratase family protein [bacterium]
MIPIEEKIKKIQGPILVLGASGFLGANLLRTLLKYRQDAFGTFFHSPAWRLEGLPAQNMIQTDLLVDSNLDAILKQTGAKTIFNCVAYGAYSFETNSSLIYQTNFNLTEKLLARLTKLEIAGYIHSGSSSEYGDKASGPTESDLPEPNSDYAVSKVSTANLIHFYGRKKGLPCANLRLYSIYGPLEDSSRLIPNIIKQGLLGQYPALVNPEISRDFVYVDDVCEAFADAANNLPAANYGDSFNIGSGQKTTIRTVADAAKEIFKIKAQPDFNSMPERIWDVQDWFANINKTKQILRWQSHTTLAEGLKATAEWYGSLEDKDKYEKSSKKFELDSKHSVSAIIACYKDGQAVPIMYERLKTTFDKLKIDYEIIFVNDNSPDNCEEVILEISRKDRRVIGISHSRNFGSQAAFRSGLEISTKNGCVLLDGDLQDPPELIEKFVEKWREGYEVIYGHRTKRQAPFYMQIAYKLFYRIFDYFSYLRIPHDAGDFSLLDRRVVTAILQFPERDFFLRGVRAYVGFKQIGVDYLRPERLFGKTTNNFFKNVDWAKKGILSYSYTPLSILSFAGVGLFFMSVGLAILQITLRILFPDIAPKGTTTVLLAILFFGSINLFALAILGEYIAKIFEEVKQRPHFIRKNITRNGETRAVQKDS